MYDVFFKQFHATFPRQHRSQDTAERQHLLGAGACCKSFERDRYVYCHSTILSKHFWRDGLPASNSCLYGRVQLFRY